LIDLYRRYSDLSLGLRILIFMVVGIVAGLVFGERAIVVQPLGDLFIRLLMMAAIPLVFFNLLAGLTNLPDIGALGRVGGRITLYYAFTTTVALTLGLTAMNWIRPGVGMQLTGEVQERFGEVPAIADVFLDLVPENVFAAFSEGNLTQVVVFAMFLGVTALVLPQEKREALQRAFDLLAELLRKLVEIIMYRGSIWRSDFWSSGDLHRRSLGYPGRHGRHLLDRSLHLHPTPTTRIPQTNRSTLCHHGGHL
jgi:Na+/H+-dicarboxylate symporter